jgi:hypothetical protein
MPDDNATAGPWIEALPPGTDIIIRAVTLPPGAICDVGIGAPADKRPITDRLHSGPNQTRIPVYLPIAGEDRVVVRFYDDTPDPPRSPAIALDYIDRATGAERRATVDDAARGHTP